MAGIGHFGAHRGSGAVALQSGLLQAPGQQSTRTLGMNGKGSDFAVSSAVGAGSQLNLGGDSAAALPLAVRDYGSPGKGPTNLKFGLNPKTKIGGGPSGLAGGPMRGIHPHPFSHPFKRAKLNDALKQKNEELAKMILPEIKTRKLDDLFQEGAENPFRVHKTGEQMLVFREKQR